MPATLKHWDELLEKPLAAESLVVSYFDNERPLRGVAGLVDWRMRGALSRLLVSGRCTGTKHESLMMPAGARLPFQRIFLFGLGNGKRMDDDIFQKHAEWMCGVLDKAGVTNYALQPPGRATGLIGARRAAELWRDIGKSSARAITLIDGLGTHKEMGDVLIAS